MRYLRRLLEAISLFFAGFAAVCAWAGNDMAAAECLLFAGVSAVVRFAVRRMPEKGRLATLSKDALAAIPEAEQQTYAELYEKAQKDYKELSLSQKKEKEDIKEKDASKTDKKDNKKKTE